jgi:hypothetical protein
VSAFAQQIEIEVAEHGREAVGIVEIDDVFAEAGAELVAFGAVRQRACEQPGIVNSLKRRRLAMLTTLEASGMKARTTLWPPSLCKPR